MVQSSRVSLVLLQYENTIYIFKIGIIIGQRALVLLDDQMLSCQGENGYSGILFDFTYVVASSSN